MKISRKMRMMVLVLVLSLCMPVAGSFEAQAKYYNTYDSEGNFYDSTGHKIKKSTIKHLLQTALKPVGKCMYVWGGGHNQTVSTTIGVLPGWETYFKKQTKSYYHGYRLNAYDGLDCSGYVGWVLYNTFNTESGHGSFTTLAQYMTKLYASYGWGKYKSARKFTNQKAGDIMSLAAGHVYIVVGRCSDGSLVILHSSPQGVMINGTVSKKGKKKSKAWKLARKYMKRYYPEWMAKYRDVRRSSSYLSQYSKMSWYISKTNSVMSDPEGLRKMSADQVLKVIFNE